jgi:hypothetical protein
LKSCKFTNEIRMRIFFKYNKNIFFLDSFIY